MENKEPYNQRDHEHCWNQKVSACGIEKSSHKVCCLCEKPMENKETNEKSGWEEEFYGLTKTMDGQHRPKLLLFIKNVEKEAYERGKEHGKYLETVRRMTSDAKAIADYRNIPEDKAEVVLKSARLEGKKEAEVALIAELEGMKVEEKRPKPGYNHGVNKTLDLIISNLRERL